MERMDENENCHAKIPGQCVWLDEGNMLLETMCSLHDICKQTLGKIPKGEGMGTMYQSHT
jgi:hypothetical protein